MKTNFRTIIASSLLLQAAVCPVAALADDTTTTPADEPRSMYLIKGDRVVGKYDVDAVDYVSFKLPDGIQQESLWLTVDDVTKNSVTYTVNAINPSTAYAHGIISYYDANYIAMDIYGDYIDNLSDADREYILRYAIYSVGYLGYGTTSFSRTDWDYDGYTHIHVTPGTKYYLLALEVDPATQDPLDTFVYTEFTTADPAQSTATLSVTFKRQNSDGLAFNVTGSDDILYVMTAFGKQDIMAQYYELFGGDFLFGTFAQSYTLDELQGANTTNPDIEAATWDAYENGEYILMVRAYDRNGDIIEKMATATYTSATATEGPEIKIFSKTKGDGKVSVNFEISPSNVTEAYVNLLKENDVNDLINDRWELWEIASNSKSTDIVDIINRDGEYTFKADGLDDSWYTILIYAKDKQGAKTVQRINFNTLEGSNWSIPSPVHAPAQRPGAAARARLASLSHRPTIDRVK